DPPGAGVRGAGGRDRAGDGAASAADLPDPGPSPLTKIFSSVLDSHCIARYTIGMMKNEITTQITTAYQTIVARTGRRPGDWITLTDLRIELDESFPRYEIDEALREMYRTQQANLVPESNQKILTEWDRWSAVEIGEQMK